MRYCDSCKINICENISDCPLCSEALSGQISSNIASYPKINIQLKKLSRLKIALIASQILLVLAITVAAILKGHSAWFFVICGGFIYAVFSIMQSIRAKENPGFMILKQIMLICIIGFVMDYFNGFTYWSTNYMIPFLVTLGAFIITVIILLKPIWFKDYLIYQITLIIFGVLSLFLRVFNLSTVRWTATFAAIYSIITALGLIIFAGRKTKLEFKKRFHV